MNDEILSQIRFNAEQAVKRDDPMIPTPTGYLLAMLNEIDYLNDELDRMRAALEKLLPDVKSHSD